MRNFEKSHKLDNVCYDIRGPIMDEANRMAENGIEATLHRLILLRLMRLLSI